MNTIITVELKQLGNMRCFDTGNDLKMYRIRLNKSQREMSKDTGITFNRYRILEQAKDLKQSMHVHELEKLNKFFDLYTEK